MKKLSHVKHVSRWLLWWNDERGMSMCILVLLLIILNLSLHSSKDWKGVTISNMVELVEKYSSVPFSVSSLQRSKCHEIKGHRYHYILSIFN